MPSPVACAALVLSSALGACTPTTERPEQPPSVGVLDLRTLEGPTSFLVQTNGYYLNLGVMGGCHVFATSEDALLLNFDRSVLLECCGGVRVAERSRVTVEGRFFPARSATARGRFLTCTVEPSAPDAGSSR